MATISMPTVVFDEPSCDATLDGTPPTIIPCSTAAGELIVEVNLHIARPPGDSFRGPT